MLIIYAGAAGLAVAAVRLLAASRRGGAASVAASPLRWWPLAVGCLLLQLYLVRGSGMDLPSAWRPGLLWATYLALAAVALVNLRRPWMGVVVAGLLLNLLAMAANGGLMPVSPETLVRAGNGHVLDRVAVGQPLPRSKDVILRQEDTRLAFLSDVLVLPGRRGSFSLGDVLIAAGVFLVLQAAGAVAAAQSPPAAAPVKTAVGASGQC